MSNNSFSVDIEKNIMRKYEKNIIASGKLDFFIPMSFIDLGKKERIVYDYTGYISLDSIEEGFDVKTTFDFLEKILYILLQAEDHLIDPSKLHLTCSTAYVSKENNDVRLIYLPTNNENKNLNKNIIEFLEDMESKYMSKGAKEYLNIIKNYLKQNSGVDEIINRICSIKREAYICGIN